MLAIALALMATLSASAGKNRTSGERPNFLVIIVDDLGFMDIEANNENSFYDTPHINRLAEAGMRFTDGYAASPVCSPTRYSLMTGKYPTRVDATSHFVKNPSRLRGGQFESAPQINYMPLDEVTLAEMLKEEGYATFFAGKWHLGKTEKYFPQNRGFDFNIGGHASGGPYTGRKYFAPFKNPQMKDREDDYHLPNRLANETAAFIDANKDTPFLAYLSFYSVHTPLQGRPDLVEKYKAEAASVVGAELGEEEQVTGKRERRVRILQKHAVYAAMVEAMDEAVGKVIKQLEDSGVVDDTIVIFTSDNGGLSTSEGLPTSNLPLRGGKGWTYEGGIRVPWIIRYPGVTEPGSLSNQPIASIDLYPTVASAAGVAIGHTIDGIDLLPALKGQSLDRQSLYWHYPHYSNQGGIPSGAIREGDFKLIERYEDGRVHLYNLKDDLGEQNDIADMHPERVTRMRARLHAWYETVDAKFLQPKDDGPAPWRP